jgi:hypothetical protein
MKKLRDDPLSKQRLHRRLSPISRYLNASHTIEGFKMKPNRASENPFVMMERLVNQLSNSKDISCPANPNNEKKSNETYVTTPIQSLRVFKEALKEDDLPLRFDLMSLNWRCIQLLRRIQKICVEQSPTDYPAKDYDGDDKINVVIMQMLAGVAGVPRRQPTRFPEACALVREFTAREGNLEYMLAQERKGILHLTAVNPKDDPENFEDPDVHFIPHALREHMHQFSAEEMAQLKTR